jgi:hypothetical protein
MKENGIVNLMNLTLVKNDVEITFLMNTPWVFSEINLPSAIER